jgi:hypothetical protein
MAAGRLVFDALGRLASVQEQRPFVIPTTDGKLGVQVRLDFDARSDGGSGVNGVTAFSAMTRVWFRAQDGELPRFGAGCVSQVHLDLERPALERQELLWVRPDSVGRGEFTARVDVSSDFEHPRAVTDQTPKSLMASTQITGADGRSARLEVRVERLGATRYRYDVAWYREGLWHAFPSAQLEFAEDGSLLHGDALPPFNLPLEDGSAGPDVRVCLGADLDVSGLPCGYANASAFGGFDPPEVRVHPERWSDWALVGQ